MKNYGLKFGTGNPANFTGLSPTFTTFFNTTTAATLAPPGVTEIFPSSGLYRFQYAPSFSIFFVVDGGSALASGDRYITGILDPVQAVDEKVGADGDSFGSTSADPSTIFGMAKRNLEFHEGNAVFTKATGLWDVYSRGSSTLLREKALTNTTTAAGKT